MVRKLLICVCLLSFILWNISDTFGDDRCMYDSGHGLKDYTHRQPNHICKKMKSNFCYFPKTDKTLTPHYFEDEPYVPDLPNTKFSSKYGGCSLSYPKGALSVGLDADKYIKFHKACGDSYDFSTRVNFVSHLYKGGESIAYSISDDEKSKIIAIKK